MSGLYEETGITKSKICIVGSILLVILGLSFAFIWSGSIFYGLVVLGLPVMCIILTTYCYVTQDPEVEWQSPIPAFDAEEQNLNLSRLNDRPPSYRMTWRRSFIKKFRRSGPEPSSPVTATETVFGESDTLTRNTIQLELSLESEPSNKVVDESPRLSEEMIDVTTENPSVVEVGDDVTDLNSEITNSDRNINKLAISNQPSLPSYEEAIIIMKSTENLSN